MRRCLSALVIAGALSALGCASQFAPPILSDTQLGRVIIYRNGVAYFERYAPPGEEKLVMRVPSQRVDDFLKSLSVVDEKTGKTMPISYPTVQSYDGYVEMTIKLPKDHARLKITYVTESPAWKPSYRVVLAEDGKATLLGWAVVDNVSGEDWKNVRVGVGSTSALSFRYDLHSVRLVERETLGTGAPLAAAPPTGGSPYAVASRKVRVIGSIRAGELDQATQAGAPPPPPEPASETTADDEDRKYDRGERYKYKAAKKAPQQQLAGGRMSGIASQLRSGNHRVRVEGYAQAGDSDPERQSLERANRVRARLLALGVPAQNVVAVGTGQLNAREAVRMVDVGDDDAQATVAGQAGEGGVGKDGQVAGAADSQPLGQAHFVSRTAITIESDHSAMVSIMNAPVEAQQVYYYDPLSTRGSTKFAFNAVRIVNPSQYTLDTGPFTVYAAHGQFLGEGMSEAILPGSVAFIPYALDRSVLCDPEVSTHEEIDKLVTIVRGIATAESRRVRRTTLTLTNRAKKDAVVYVRHRVAPGYELSKKHKEVEKLGGAHLFKVALKAGEAVKLSIEEDTPLLKTVDIRTPTGIKAMVVYLKTAKLTPAVEARLREIIAAHTKRADLQDHIDTLAEQMVVYRTRVDEINVQLVTLRKVPQAQKLRAHLAKKMEEISEKLQQATMQMSDLKGQMMALGIELQDKIAELTLQTKKDNAGSDGDAKAVVAGP